MLGGLEHLSQPKRRGVVWPGEMKAAGRADCGLPVPKGACKRGGKALFTWVCSDRTKNKVFKLKEERFRLGVVKQFLTLCLVGHWDNLPR